MSLAVQGAAAAGAGALAGAAVPADVADVDVPGDLGEGLHDLHPDLGVGEPTGDLANAINEQLGGFANFKEQLSNAAATRFGSGWGWLVRNGCLILSSVFSTQPSAITGWR